MKLPGLIILFLQGMVISNVFAQPTDNFSEVQKVIISNGILLSVEQTPGHFFRFKTMDPDSSCITKTFENGILTLNRLSKHRCRGKVSAALGCPFISEIEVSGKAEVSTKNLLKGDSLLLTVKSRGKAYLDMDVKYLKSKISEGGLLNAEGYATIQEAIVASSATYSAYNLEGDDINIKVTSGGTARICAAKKLEAQTIGNSYISYKCNPGEKKLDTNSGGIIEPFAE